MRELLNANLSRLLKSKALWAAAAVLLIWSAGSMLNGCRQAAMSEMTSSPLFLDHYYFELAPLLGLFGAVFISLFLGTEYSDGTIRNKIVVGHSREGIFLANFIACLTASLVFFGAWLLGGLVGIPFLGGFHMPAAQLLCCLLLAVLFTTALCALFTALGSVFSNKATGAATAILVFLALLVLASVLYNRLSEPEMYSGMVMTAQGMEMSEPTPNPDYLSGSARTVCEVLLELLPTGQGILLANLEIAHPLRMALFSLLIIGCAVGAGIFVFRRKDLK